MSDRTSISDVTITQTASDTDVTLVVDTVRAALAHVPYPGMTRDLVSFGMVSHVSVCGTQVKVELALTSRDPGIQPRLHAAVTETLR